MIDAHSILIEVLSSFEDASKWVDAPFERVKRISNSHVGSVGQTFIERLCGELNCACKFPEDKKGKKSKISPWDIEIEGVKFELKTATEDVSGNFQFNHVRYHREYDALICLGISPDNIGFDAWTAADVKTNKAGKLVSMEKGANASFKLTKRKSQLRPIDEFKKVIIRLTNQRK